MAKRNTPPDATFKNFDRRRHVWIMGLVKDAELTSTALRVGILLAETYMNRKKGGRAWPSVATLCADLSASERSVQGGIKQLVESGYLAREIRDGKTPFYAMGENTETQKVKTERKDRQQADDPRRKLHPSTPADSCASPPQFPAPDPRRFLRQPPQESAPEPIEEPSEGTSVKEPGHSPSAHALVREGENPPSGNLTGQPAPSPSGKIGPAAKSQEAFRKAALTTSAKPDKITPSGKFASPDQGELILAPKLAHRSDASLPPELIEPFGEFYDKAFPFARDRGAARDAFRWAVIIAGAKPTELIETARHYAAERAHDRRDGATVQQYTTKPAKWLRAESWKNAPVPTPAMEAERARFNGSTRPSRGAAAQAYDAAMCVAIVAATPLKTDDSGF